MAGFTKQQIESLDALFDRQFDILFDRLQDDFRKRSSAPPSAQLSTSPIAHLPASLPAPQACASTPPELPPQRPPQPPALPPTNPPTTPSPCVETVQEVEHKHTWKHRASKAVPTIRVSKTFENCIEGPPKSSGIHMRFSRDEEPDAWYTTMLNHKQKLATGAILHPA